MKESFVTFVRRCMRVRLLQASTLVVVLLSSNAFASDVPETKFRSCADCEKVNDFKFLIRQDARRSDSRFTGAPATYFVVSESHPRIAIAKVTFFYHARSAQYWPSIEMVTATDEETLFADSLMLARAALAASQIDELPTVTYPRNDTCVCGHPASYQTDAWLFMNGNPLVVIPATTGGVATSMALSKLAEKMNTFWSKIWSRAPISEVATFYVRLNFADGSYGVFQVAASTSSVKAHEVYYVKKDGTVVIVDSDKLGGIEDPNIEEELQGSYRSRMRPTLYNFYVAGHRLGLRTRPIMATRIASQFGQPRVIITDLPSP